MAAYSPLTDSQSMPISTRTDLRPGEWFNDLQKYARYPMCELLWNSGIFKTWSGTKFTWRIADNPGDPKPATSMYKTFSADNQNRLYRAEIEPKHHEETFGLDETEEDMNSSEAQLVDETKLGLTQMYQRACDSVEDHAFSTNVTAGQLDEIPLNYYVNIPSNANGTFCGQVPAGQTLVANVDPITAHQEYRNYANLFTAYTNEDFGLKTSQMLESIDFNPPPQATGGESGPGIDALRIYTAPTSMSNFELSRTYQNDQLGSDAVPMFRRTMVKGITPVTVPALEPTTRNGLTLAGSEPWYFLNHFHLFPVFIPNWHFREKAGQVPMSHMKWWGVFWKYNWVCTKRRVQGALGKLAPFGEGAFV